MRIAVIAGDGIGRDVAAEALKALIAADHYLKTGETLPANGYQLVREFDAIFAGALGDLKASAA